MTAEHRRAPGNPAPRSRRHIVDPTTRHPMTALIDTLLGITIALSIMLGALAIITGATRLITRHRER